MPETKPPFESQYPEFNLPPEGWRSNIPQHLLEGASEMDVWMMNELSKNSQATDFACRGAVELSHYLRALNGKTYRNEKGVGELTESVAAMQADIATLKTQMAAALPVTTLLVQARELATNKMFLFILALAALFLLGFNRDILVNIFKAFYS